MPPKGWKKPPTPPDHSDTLLAIVHELRLSLRDLQERYEQAESRHQEERKLWLQSQLQPQRPAPAQRPPASVYAQRELEELAYSPAPKDAAHLPRDLTGDIAAMRIASPDFRKAAEQVLVAEPAPAKES